MLKNFHLAHIFSTLAIDSTVQTCYYRIDKQRRKQMNEIDLQVKILQLMYMELGDEKATLDPYDDYEQQDRHSISFTRRRLAGLIYRISKQHIQSDGSL